MTSHEPEPETAEVDTEDQHDSAPPVDPDTQSDPALDDGESTEWASEGGATPDGPATDESGA